MRKLDLQPTSTAHWHKLVCEAEHQSQRSLGEELQSYLVFLLQRFLDRPDLAGRVLALDYLKSFRIAGQRQIARLREVGDLCLLYAGFFPQRARRRRLSVKYYVDLGVGAYYQLHHNTAHHQGRLYEHLYEGFVPAMDVLQAMRNLDGAQNVLDPLTAHELWQYTDSSQARRYLQDISGGSPLAASESPDKSRRH
ncbi:MAG TPA: hypothetical protein ENI97_09230 [Gammaproteobacteria bacterium]|nr:hypothetical protein [Gammaproteobacteria bacterium]